MFSAQIQAPIQRIYCMNKPGKLKKMALLASSYSPDVYDGAIGEYRGILSYWGVEDTGIVFGTTRRLRAYPRPCLLRRSSVATRRPSR